MSIVAPKLNNSTLAASNTQNVTTETDLNKKDIEKSLFPKIATKRNWFAKLAFKFREPQPSDMKDPASKLDFQMQKMINYKN